MTLLNLNLILQRCCVITGLLSRVKHDTATVDHENLRQRVYKIYTLKTSGNFKESVCVIQLRSESERQRSCLCSGRAMDNVPIDRFACFENGNYKRIVSINVSVTITHLPSSKWHREKLARKTVLNKKHRRITAIMFAANAVLRQLSGRK